MTGWWSAMWLQSEQDTSHTHTPSSTQAQYPVPHIHSFPSRALVKCVFIRGSRLRVQVGDVYRPNPHLEVQFRRAKPVKSWSDLHSDELKKHKTQQAHSVLLWNPPIYRSKCVKTNLDSETPPLMCSDLEIPTGPPAPDKQMLGFDPIRDGLVLLWRVRF